MLLEMLAHERGAAPDGAPARGQAPGLASTTADLTPVPVAVLPATPTSDSAHAGGHTWRRALPASLVGLAVEFTWAAGESVIVPFLLEAGLAPSLSGLVFIANPLVTIPLHPVLGAWSDRCQSRLGRRRPFIVALTLVGVAGIATLVLSGTGTAGGTGVIGAGAVVPLAFAGFCVSDVAHDCLLGPGRALAGDQAASDKERAGAHAMFSGMQMLGRFLAMVLGSLPLKRLVAHARAGVAVHMQVLMAISGGVLLLCSLLAVLAVSEERFHGGEPRCADEDAEAGRSSEAEGGPVRVPAAGDGGALGGPPSPSPARGGRLGLLLRHRELCGTLMLVFMGWVGNMVVCFYWTQWLGELSVGQGAAVWWLPADGLRVAFVGLAAGALVSMLTAACLPRLNAWLGAWNVFVAGGSLLGVLMMATPFVRKGVPWTSVLLAAGMGAGYATQCNNPYALVEDIADRAAALGDGGPAAQGRGQIIGTVNITMPVAQIVVGACAGSVIHATNDDPSVLFCAVGALLLGANLCAVAARLHVCRREQQARAL